MNIFKHYKGNLYEYIGTGIHTETEEFLVFYRSVEEGKLYVRPYEMFHEMVEYNGVLVKRFEELI